MKFSKSTTIIIGLQSTIMNLMKAAIPSRVGLNRLASGEYFCGRDTSTALSMTILVRSCATFARVMGRLTAALSGDEESPGNAEHLAS